MPTLIEQTRDHPLPRPLFRLLKLPDNANAALAQSASGAKPSTAIPTEGRSRALVLPIGAGNNQQGNILVEHIYRVGQADAFIPIIAFTALVTFRNTLAIDATIEAELAFPDGAFFADTIALAAATSQLVAGKHEIGTNSVGGVVVNCDGADFINGKTQITTAASMGLLVAFFDVQR